MLPIAPPVYLGEALIYFFNNVQLNIYQGNVPINLMNWFPLLKQGLADVGAFTMLFNYTVMNGLRVGQLIIPDDLFNKAFNSNIPASFYPLYEGWISMNEAVEKGFIPKALNTFQVIKIVHPEFKPESFDLTYIGDINSVNSCRNESITDLLKNQLSIEMSAAREIGNIMPVYTFQTRFAKSYKLTLEKFIRLSIKMYEEKKEYWSHNYILQLMITDSWIYLMYAIIIEDIGLITELLIKVNPRIHNNEAYKLALKLRNPEIIEIIKSRAAELNWYETQVYTTGLEPIIGYPSTVPQTLLEYSRI